MLYNLSGAAYNPIQKNIGKKVEKRDSNPWV